MLADLLLIAAALSSLAVNTVDATAPRADSLDPAQGSPASEPEKVEALLDLLGLCKSSIDETNWTKSQAELISALETRGYKRTGILDDGFAKAQKYGIGEVYFVGFGRGRIPIKNNPNDRINQQFCTVSINFSDPPPDADLKSLIGRRIGIEFGSSSTDYYLFSMRNWISYKRVDRLYVQHIAVSFGKLV